MRVRQQGKEICVLLHLDANRSGHTLRLGQNIAIVAFVVDGSNVAAPGVRGIRITANDFAITLAGFRVIAFAFPNIGKLQLRVQRRLASCGFFQIKGAVQQIFGFRALAIGGVNRRH